MTTLLKLTTPLMLAIALVGCNKTEKTTETPAVASPTTPAVVPATNNSATATPDSANTATAVANTANMTPEQHKDAREDIMKSWGKASKAMGAMVKNPSTFNASTFKAEADKLNQDPWGHFGAGTEGGESKATVWSDNATFQQEIDKYKKVSSALITAAGTATSVDGVKAQFGDVGASCKSCHEKFKED